MSTPSLAEALKAWRKVTTATDAFVDSLTTEDLLKDLPLNGRRTGAESGLRDPAAHVPLLVPYRGDSAIRQILGHKRLPVYVGNIEGKAPYRPEEGVRPE